MVGRMVRGMVGADGEGMGRMKGMGRMVKGMVRGMGRMVRGMVEYY